MEMREISEGYTSIGDDLISSETILAPLRAIRIKFLKSDNNRTDKRAETEILPVKYRWMCDATVTVFDHNIALFTNEQIKILIFQQLLKIRVTINGTEISIQKNDYDLEDFKAIVRRFGTDWDSPGPELPFDEEQIGDVDGFDIFGGDN